MTGPTEAMDWFEGELAQKFSVTPMGLAQYIVGVQIRQHAKGVTISQSTYIKRLVQELGLEESHRVFVPISGGDIAQSFGEMAINPNGTQEQPKLANPTEYRHIVGRLMYAMVGTCPDIAFAVGILGRFMHKPLAKHLEMARKLVRYLNHTSDRSITYLQEQEELILEGFCDADWAEDKSDRKSTSGYIFTFNRAPICWT